MLNKLLAWNAIFVTSLCVAWILPCGTQAENATDSLILEPADKNHPDKKTSSSFNNQVPPTHLSLGANVLGAQARWNLTSQWAVEERYQRGKASSNYGDVTAQVFGTRFYRFAHQDSRFPFYLGSEVAYTTAKPQTSVYKTEGMAAGLFGGVQIKLSRWLWLDTDLGPYVISLLESHTHQSSTNLDFVLNTALVVKLF